MKTVTFKSPFYPYIATIGDTRYEFGATSQTIPDSHAEEIRSKFGEEVVDIIDAGQTNSETPVIETKEKTTVAPTVADVALIQTEAGDKPKRTRKVANKLDKEDK